LSGGVIVRIRIGDDRDDATAKLRPCDDTKLAGSRETLLVGWDSGVLASASVLGPAAR
jgi:hypothetical protein